MHIKEGKIYKDTGIYYLRNKINGKIYIGQARSLRTRRHNFLTDKKYAGPVLNKARTKYGIDAFEYGILTHCCVEELDKFEKFYIKRLNTKIPNGYNMTDGGDGFKGGKWSEEQKQNCRKRMKGENNPNYGHRWNDAQKKRASEHMKNVAKQGRLSCYHTKEVSQKSYETFFKNKYGITLDELDNIVLNHVNETGSTEYASITRKYGFTHGTLKKSFKRLGIVNELGSIKNKKVVQCDKSEHDKILNIFPSLSVAREKTGIKNISSCTSGTAQSAGGYFWRFGRDNEIVSANYDEMYLKPQERPMKLSKEQYERRIEALKRFSKTVYCYDKNGKLVDICESVTKAGRKYNTSSSTIGNICRGIRKNPYLNGVTFSYDKK